MRLGRPPLPVRTERVAVRLPVGMAERIDQLFGPAQRSVFLRPVIEAALEDAERRMRRAEQRAAKRKRT